MKLFEALLLDPKAQNLVFIAAFRTLSEDNPVKGLFDSLESICSSLCKRTDVTLDALTLTSISELLATLFKRHQEDAALGSLAQVVHRKTGGNAFFVLHLIKFLDEQELVSFSTSTYRWEWDETSIREQTPVSENIVDLVQDKIQTVSDTVQVVLRCAAILGMARFDTETLYCVVQAVQSISDDREECHPDPQERTTTKLSSLDDLSTFLNVAAEEGLVEMIYPWKYKWSHDRIQETAASLLPKNVGELHNCVGSRFLELSVDIPDDDTNSRFKKEKYFLLAVQQFQRSCKTGYPLSYDEHVTLAGLHLKAAQMNVNRSAFFPALDHLQDCIALLGPEGRRWVDHYDLMLRTSTIRAQMYLACGYPDDECKGIVDDIIQHGRTMQDKIGAYDCLVHLLTVQSDFEKALAACLEVLDNLGVHLPRRYHMFHVLTGVVSLKQKLRKKTDEKLLHLPPMSDQNMIHALRLLSQVVEAAFFAVKPTYLALAVIHQLRISMKCGSCDQTAEAFSHGAMLFGQIGDYESAFRIGQLGYELAKKARTHHDGLAIFVTFYFINHWQRPYNESLNPMMHAHQVMIDCGGFHKAWYPLIAYALLYYCCGLTLEPLARDLKKYADTMIDCGQKMHIQHTLPLQQMVLNFMGQSDDPLVLTGEVMEQTKFLKETENVPRARNEYHRCRMILAYYFGDLSLAEEMSERMPDADEEGSVAMLPMHFFYQGLIALSLARTTTKGKYRRKARMYTSQIRTWVKKGNPNCHHMLLLLQAETMGLSKAEKMTSRVKKEYSDAIASAARAGFLHHQALGNERAALFFVSRGDHSWATLYFQNARNLYEEYGAMAKAQHVDQQCNELDLSLRESVRPSSSLHFARERVAERGSLLAKGNEAGWLEETEVTETNASSRSLAKPQLLWDSSSKGVTPSSN